MKISACIIAFNEESNLPRCLGSLLSVADEIIVVVNSSSTDRTISIAEEFGAKVITKEWMGFVAQKNFAIQQTKYDWILSLDADEELSQELQKEIRTLKKDSDLKDKDGFSISRVVFFQNHWIRFGDWYPDQLVRLFRKDRARFEGGSVHERLVVQGNVSKLKEEIYHYTYKNREDQYKRIDHYSSLWAEDALKKGVKCHVWSPMLHSTWRLFRGFVIKNGWRGGLLGWQISCACAYEVRLKYEKLLKLRNNRNKHLSS